MDLCLALPIYHFLYLVQSLANMGLELDPKYVLTVVQSCKVYQELCLPSCYIAMGLRYLLVFPIYYDL